MLADRSILKQEHNKSFEQRIFFNLDSYLPEFSHEINLKCRFARDLFGGKGCSHLHGLIGYVRPQRVWLIRVSILADFGHFGNK